MSPARIGRSSDASISPVVEPAAGWCRRCASPAASPASACAASVERRPRRRPAWPSSALLGRPDLDQPGVADAVGDVARSASPQRSAPGVRVADRRRRRRPRPAAARRRGTTGSAARAARCRPAARCLRAKRLAHVGEHGRAPRPGSCRSTASRRRRRTACAPRRARRVPAKNSSASARITCHCIGARVLRLVDQDVVDAAVELEEHPRGRLAVRQQVDGLGDQIVEVERGAARLGRACSAAARRWRAGAAPSSPSTTRERLALAASERHEPRLRALGALVEIG